MSSHEWRIAYRKAAAEAKAKEMQWTKMCMEAGFREDEVGSVTVRMLHERLYGPVSGTPLTALLH